MNNLKKCILSGMLSTVALAAGVPAGAAMAAEPVAVQVEAQSGSVVDVNNSDLMSSSITFKKGDKVFSQPFVNFLPTEMAAVAGSGVYTGLDGFYAVMSNKAVLEQYIALVNQNLAQDMYNEAVVIMNDDLNGSYTYGTYVFQIGNEVKKYLDDELVYHAQGVKNGDIVLDLDSLVLDKAYISNGNKMTSVSLVGSYETDYHTSSASRCNNVELAAANFNNTVVAPGETISVSTLFKPRTIQNGYKVAGVFSGGQKSSGVGGGICQVSTTIYCASLQAGVSVVERHPHSLPVAYVPKGMDATISYPTLDLKLRNDFDTPILYRTRTQNKKVAVDVYKVN